MSDIVNSLQSFRPKNFNSFSTQDNDETVIVQPNASSGSSIMDSLQSFRPKKAIPSPTSRVTLDSPEDDDELGLVVDVDNIRSYEDIRRNPNLQVIAQRFAKEHLGEDDLSGQDAIDEFISHFRDFNVNELTAGGDFNYVSGLRADAEKGASYSPKAKRKLDDYRTLYTAFNAMPDFYESDGAPDALGDYAAGIFTAPSTYVGLLLPGFGKGAGLAASMAAKTGVSRVLSGLAARPVLTTMGVEGGAGILQDVAAQNVEQEIDVRDEYSLGRTAAVGTISAALPGGLALNAAKKAAVTAAEAGTPDIIAKAVAAQTAKNVEAGKKAAETLKKNKALGDKVRKGLDALDPEKVAAGTEKKAGIADEAGIGGDFALAIIPEKRDAVIASIVEFANKAKIKMEPKERVSAFLARAASSMEADKLSKTAEDIMNKYNLTQDDFSNVLLADFSEAGKTLQTASQLRKILSAANEPIFAIDKEARDILKKTVKSAEDGNGRNALESVQDGVRSLDQLRLALMTSQAATTYRNTAGGGIRLGVDFATKVLDRSIATGFKALGRKGAVGFTDYVPNNDTFSMLAAFSNRKRTNAVIELFKANYPKQSGRLFRELADIERTGQTGPISQGMQRLGREFNTLNTISDNMFKSVAFVGELERALNEAFVRATAAGKKVNPDDYNLTKIAEEGNLNKLFQGGDKYGKKLLDDVIDRTLSFTYQRSPTRGSFGDLLIKSMNKAPFLTTSLMPFPRFVANAMRFTYEYSPAYLLSKPSRDAIFGKSANYEDVAKGLVGLGMYNGAVAFRESEYAGEKWYEGKTKDGKTYDLRPFFPAAPFLFFADLVVKAKSDEFEPMDKDVFIGAVQALTGSQMRAGFGLYAMDKAFEDFVNASADPEADNYEAIQKIGANFVGNIAATYSMPMTMIQDVDNTFFAPDDARLARQTDSSDMLSLIVAKSVARLPRNYRIEEFLAEDLGTRPSEIYESPTKAEPIRRVAPIRRQVTGMLVGERKTKLEKEMDRLKIRRSEMYKKTRVPEANQYISMFMGEYATDYLVPKVIESDYYKSLDNEGQRKYLKLHISQWREDILESVREYSREKGPQKYGFDPMTMAEFKTLDPYYRKMAIRQYEQAYGPIDKNNPADLDLIIKAAKFFKNNKYFSPEGAIQ